MKTRACAALLLVVWILPLAAQNPVAVVNGASFTAKFPVAPGSVASAFGDFGNVTEGWAAAIPLPPVLNQVEVKVNGVASPLYYVSGLQINFQVPQATIAGRANVEVLVSGAVVAAGKMDVLPACPGLFVADFNSPNLPGAILNQDNSPNSAAQPAKRGEAIQIFATGQGTDLSSSVPDGDLGIGVTTNAQPEVYILVDEASVEYSGLAPCCVGLWQINARIPDKSYISGAIPVQVVFEGIFTNTVSIVVEQ